MPHDAKGNLIKEGDIVTFLGRVKSITPNETTCNVTVELQGPDGEYLPTISCNSKLCVRQEEWSDVAQAARAGYSTLHGDNI